MLDDQEDLGRLLSRIPDGASEGSIGDASYVVRRETGVSGYVIKLFAERVGTPEFISANVYRVSTKLHLKPCEMPAEKVLNFLRAIEIKRVGVYTDAELYAAAFPPPEDATIDWLLEQTTPVNAVLEPFCGHAPAAAQIIGRGARYVGIDRSAEMLARAGAVDGMTLVRADVTWFELPARAAGPFDLAWCPVNSIAHLSTEAAVISHLECVRANVRPGGVYAIELELTNEDSNPTEVTWSVDIDDGRRVEATWACSHGDSETHTRQHSGVFRLLENGDEIRRVREEFTMRMWTSDDLIRLSRRAGWTLELRAYPTGIVGPNDPVPLSPSLMRTGCNWTFLLRNEPSRNSGSV